MLNFDLTNPTPEPDRKQAERPQFDFDFDVANAPDVNERHRECATCWKFRECELRKSGAKGCAEIF
jgi:hypothetical protein